MTMTVWSSAQELKQGGVGEARDRCDGGRGDENMDVMRYELKGTHRVTLLNGSARVKRGDRGKMRSNQIGSCYGRWPAVSSEWTDGARQGLWAGRGTKWGWEEPRRGTKY